jgi:hypothetical protein
MLAVTISSENRLPRSVGLGVRLTVGREGAAEEEYPCGSILGAWGVVGYGHTVVLDSV